MTRSSEPCSRPPQAALAPFLTAALRSHPQSPTVSPCCRRHHHTPQISIPAPIPKPDPGDGVCGTTPPADSTRTPSRTQTQSHGVRTGPATTTAEPTSLRPPLSLRPPHRATEAYYHRHHPLLYHHHSLARGRRPRQGAPLTSSPRRRRSCLAHFTQLTAL